MCWALPRMIMDARLPVRLRVLIPAVENAISGDAFRPGDVLTSRKGLTVEIGNTDAEGRLVLADALALADRGKPRPADRHGDADRRGARGARPRPAALLHRRRGAGRAICRRRRRVRTIPLWRLPLWQPYNALFESTIADINNAGSSGFAGSITAALFLPALRGQGPRSGCISISSPGRRRRARAARRAARRRRSAPSTHLIAERYR